MTRSLILAGALLLTACLAGADTIYLRGKDQAVEGKAVRSGDKYIIELTGGGKMEVNVNDVVYIHAEAGSGDTSTPAGTPTQTTTTPPVTAGPGVAASKPAAGEGPVVGSGSVDIAGVTMPETMVFSTMRAMSSAGPGADSFELRKQLEKWRAAVHDRQRKIGPGWVGPKEFVQHRAGFEEMTKEAQTMAGKARNKPNVKELMGPVYAKLRQAAITWEDPLIKNFLLGVADYQAGLLLQAYGDFQQGHRDAPYFAAFSQGEAMSLTDLDRALEALVPACEYLRMRDESTDAYTLLNQIMAKAPGTDLRAPAYLQARDLLAQFQAPAAPSGSVNKSITWSMPAGSNNRGWVSRDDSTLPVPPFDRFIVRQAMAIPVTENTLLVDGALNDAIDVIVRVEGGRYVQGVVKKATGSKTAGPLTLITVSSCSFTPVTRTDTPEELKDKDATVFAAGLYPELGANPRLGKVKIRVDKDTIHLPGALMPGESTSPVVTDAGQLVGFVTGRTEVMQENGGDEKIIPLTEIGMMLKNLKTTGAGSSSSRLKRTGTPAPQKDRAFMVYGIFGEKFESK